MNVKRVLLPTDLSDCSLRALDWAVDISASCGAELHILFVDDLSDIVALAAYTSPSVLASSARVELREQLKAIRPALSTMDCAYHYVEGVPAEQIVAFAASEDIDLIVMSSHGRSGLSRVLLGSVAESVLRTARCPVLIVKAEPEGRKAACEHVSGTVEMERSNFEI